VRLTKKCGGCKQEKSLDQFSKTKSNKDGLHPHCKNCDSLKKYKSRIFGNELKKQILIESGGCQNPDCCSSHENGRLLITSSNYGLFELDHIDESLKKSSSELHADWINAHIKEFLNQVKPNLQVLCRQCHLFKSQVSHKLGNSVYQKKFGRNPPSQFIDPGYNLFNQVETIHIYSDEDNWSFEDDYSVCRDSEGFLIKYIDLLEGLTQFQVFNKDGEQI
jgi:hypothetical protein